MSATQLSFSLRVSSGVKAVHLLGSWDGYVGQLPLSRDKTSSRSGSWKGTFRFSASTLRPGQRYWYYYIIDGYHVAHNPSIASTTEPTTGRELNILDVATDALSSSASSSRSSSSRSSSSKSSSKSSKSSKSSSSKSSSSSSSKTSSSSRHSSSKDKHSRDKHDSHHSSRKSLSLDIPKGRPLSVSQIQAPKPVSPHATKHLLETDYHGAEELEELAARLGATGFHDYDSDYHHLVTANAASPTSSLGSSPFSSYRSGSSSPSSASSWSSVSGYSTPGSDCSTCTCERYGITRKGERVKLDCGGSRCGYESSSSSSGEEESEYNSRLQARRSRRHAIIVS